MECPEPSCEETLSLILDSTAKIAKETRFERLLELIAQLGTRLILCDRCTIWLLDRTSGELWTKVAQGLTTVRISRNRGIVGEAVRTAKPIIINDPYNDPRFHRKVDQETGYKTESILVIPMMGLDGKVMGAFQAVNKLNPGSDFHDQDVQRLMLAATFSAKILSAEHLLQANRHHEEEQQKAAEKQMSIIVNDFESSDRFKTQVFSKPSEILNGDSWSIYKTAAGGALAYLVDGMGHGILPSLTAFSVSSTIAQSVRRSGSLKNIAAKLLKNLKGVLSEEEQLSCAFFWLPPDTSFVEYFVAGLYPPLILDQGRTIEVMANNPPLMNFTEEILIDRIELEDFSKLLIYSDGLVEDTGFSFDRKRVVRLMDEQMFASLTQAIALNQMEDDVTLISLSKA
jgi:serine phosphatase RsbU (regulator of sigma subunit)